MNRFKRSMQVYYQYLVGYSEVEKLYIEEIFRLEEGKRSKKDIQDAYRKKVTEDMGVRMPDFASEMILKELRKKINSLK